MKSDLTIIYLTANKLPESFKNTQWNVLLKAAKGFPIIRITRDKEETLSQFGGDVTGIVYDTEPKSTDNIYRQMLRAAKMADTDYIAIAEDDCFYHEEHFRFYRPPMDTFCYDMNRFALFTWGDPMYSMRDRVSNAALIAPRKLLIEALEERFEKWPGLIPDKLVGELGRRNVEHNLGLKERKCVWKYAKVSIIQFNHGYGSEERQKLQRKSYGMVRAFDLYYWGHAKELIKKFK